MTMLRFVPPPTNAPLRDEAPPIIEPPFRGGARPTARADVSELELLLDQEHHQDSSLTESQVFTKFREHERLGTLLAGRTVFIGATRHFDCRNPEKLTLQFCFYNYDLRKTVHLHLDRNARDVLSMETDDRQPGLSASEIAQASQLAAAHERLRPLLHDRLVPGAILVERLDPDDARCGHRLADVRFGMPDERLPRLSALVDLTTNEVVSAGPLRDYCSDGKADLHG